MLLSIPSFRIKKKAIEKENKFITSLPICMGECCVNISVPKISDTGQNNENKFPDVAIVWRGAGKFFFSFESTFLPK